MLKKVCASLSIGTGNFTPEEHGGPQGIAAGCEGTSRMNKIFRMILGGAQDRRELTTGAISGVAITASNKLAMLLVAILLARMLGTSNFGTFAFCMALAPILGVLVQFGTGTLLVRRIPIIRSRGVPGLEHRFVTSARRVIWVNWLVVAAGALTIVWLGPLSIAASMQSALSVMLAFVLASALLLQVVSTLYGRQQLLHAQIAESLIAPAAMLVFVGSLFIFGVEEVTAPVALAAQALAAVIAFFFGKAAIADRTKRGIGRPANKLAYRTMVSAGGPFLLISAAMVLFAQIDTVVVGLFIGTEATGIYRIGAQVALISLAATGVLSSISAPYFSRYQSQNDIHRMKKLFKVIGMIGTAGLAAYLVLLLLVGEAAISWAFGKAFSDASLIAAIITLGYLVNYMLGPAGTLLSMGGHERLVSRYLWIAALFNLAGSVMAARWFGIAGVACVTAISVAGYHVLLRIQIRRLLGF